MSNLKQFWDESNIEKIFEDENGQNIFRVKDNGLLIRHVTVNSNKRGKEYNILNFADIHLSNWNIKDFEEKNSAVLGTIDGRRSTFKREDTFLNLNRIMDMVHLFDKTIISGDVIDYLTWGALEYVNRYIYDRCPDAVLAIGGHDVTRAVQSKVPDLSSIESRYDILKTVWRTDTFYYSECVGNKALLIVLNNGEHKYYKFQIEKLKKDIEKARKENLIILIFQHEPICTGNEKDVCIKPIWESSPGEYKNFYNSSKYIGGYDTDDVSMEMYETIVQNADVIKAIFCGHAHNEVYTQVKSYCPKTCKETYIPQYVLDAAAYDKGHAMIITIN